MNKKGSENVILETVVFVVLNVAFLSLLILGVSRATDSANLSEEAYAKQTALLLDRAKPGTELQIDISELIAVAKKNKAEPIIRLNCNENLVYVKASQSGGYEFKYFSELNECDFNRDLQKRKFIINIK